MKLYTLTLGALQTNCYILADEKNRAILVDAPDEAETILQFLKDHGLTLSEIVLTHGHFDHILALQAIHDATGAPIAIHENGEAFLRDRMRNLSHYVHIDWTPVVPQRTLRDGDRIVLGEHSYRVLHTPGHTEDCICLYGEGILLSGDTLFNRSVGRWDHPTGDMKQELDSIRQKLFALPDETMVYPGHGEATTIGDERRENPYLQ